MRCYICDHEIHDDKVHVNPRTKKIDPCPVCMAEIKDTIDGYEDQEIEQFIEDVLITEDAELDLTIDDPDFELEDC